MATIDRLAHSVANSVPAACNPSDLFAQAKNRAAFSHWRSGI
ncbi:hypothetical protein [Cupriavidus sp. UYPR2.512]|nr:hypothetical protein [Cupriavidus sp. UYPR2.512]